MTKNIPISFVIAITPPKGLNTRSTPKINVIMAITTTLVSHLFVSSFKEYKYCNLKADEIIIYIPIKSGIIDAIIVGLKNNTSDATIIIIPIAIFKYYYELRLDDVFA